MARSTPTSSSSTSPASSSASAPAQSAPASSAAGSGAAGSAPASSTPAAPPAPSRSAGYAHDPVLAQGVAIMSKKIADESKGNDTPAAPGVDFENDPDNAAPTDTLDATLGNIIDGKPATDSAAAPKTDTQAPAAKDAGTKKDDAKPSDAAQKAEKFGIAAELANELGDDLPTLLSMLEAEAPDAPADVPATKNEPAATKDQKETSAKPGEKPGEKADIFASLRGKIDDNLLDTLQTVIDARMATAEQTINTLQSRLQQADTTAQAERVAEMTKQFESAFAAVEDVFKPLIGSGPTEALAPTDPAQRLRVGVVRQAMAFMNAAAAMGSKPPTVQEAVRTVLTAKFPSRIRLAEREDIRRRAQQQSAAAVHSASRSAPPAATPEDAFEAEISAIFDRAS